MATIRISVNVANLWRTNVELKEGASWHDLKMEIKIATGICEIEQKLTPNDFDHVICELEDGDDVMCEINRNSCHHHPLLCAAGFGNVEAIRSWITSGADVDVKSEFEDTPLLSASFHIEDKCIKELLHLGTMHPFVTKTCLFRPNKQVFIRNGRNAPICNKNLFVSAKQTSFYQKWTQCAHL